MFGFGYGFGKVGRRRGGCPPPVTDSVTDPRPGYEGLVITDPRAGHEGEEITYPEGYEE